MGYFEELNEMFEVIKERDPAIKSKREVLLYPCFRAIRKYRKAHEYYLKGDYYKARKISQKAAAKTGIEIHPGATIGKGLFIDHGHGVVIGETTIIGDNVTLYQGVTLGGTGKEQGKRHPTLEDNVMVSAGAKVLGSITIGANSKVGAGSVVLNDVPPNSTVVGVPGRVVKTNEERLDCIKLQRSEMDQIHLPDPVELEICELKKQVEDLKKVVEALKDDK
ncbi:MAG: serine O-acetyltransferase [Parasporobacterium sp.]|nr:serine O-acetyltransferase [Parasporobacterium sp.]